MFTVMGLTDIPTVGSVTRELRSRGHDITILPKNETVCRKLSESSYRFSDIRKDIADHEPRRSRKELFETYGVDSPRSFVFPEMVYREDYLNAALSSSPLSRKKDIDYEPYIRELHRSISFLHHLYEEDEMGIPIQYQGGGILPRAVDLVTRERGDFPIWLGFSPLNGQTTLFDNEDMYLPKMEEQQYSSLTEEERSRALSYITAARENRSYNRSFVPYSTTLFDSLVDKIDTIKTQGLESIPIIKSYLRWKASNLRESIRNHIVSSYANRKYLDKERSEQFIKNNDYIFYPVQYFKESRITIRAPPFYNQGWFVEYLSRNLPAGYELVVKDHPQQMGALPKQTIDTLDQVATVVSVDMSAWEVADHADAVVTLNNTVGYESIIQGKPVITMGNAFYNRSGYTHDVNNLDRLTETLETAVNSGGVPEERLVEFINGIFEVSYPGRWGDTSEKNVAELTDSIESFTREKKDER